MKGFTTPWIDGVRDSLQDPEERRVYLQEAVRDLLSDASEECVLTLSLFFRATCGYSEAGEILGLSGEQMELALSDSSRLTIQQFGRLMQFALRQDKLQVAADLLLAAGTPAATIERQAA